MTLENYAAAKGLSVEFLAGLGLKTVKFGGATAVQHPYNTPNGEEATIRYRIAMTGDRFRWRKGSKPSLYGLERLSLARTAGFVLLVEGENDAQTCWQHDVPALGLPGATNWDESRDAAHMDGIDKIYVVIEPDRGGEAVKAWLAESTIRDRAFLLRLPCKDVSELHVRDQSAFRAELDKAMDAAVRWTDFGAAAIEQDREEAWAACADLAQSDDILAHLDHALGHVAGERQLIRLLYLAMTSRLHDRPVSIVVKGPSSGGKSFTVDQVLELFPQDAYEKYTAMSERLLAYDDTSIKHKMLVVYEAVGMDSEMGTYLIRSLLSEGHIRYSTVIKTRDGMKPQHIYREGPAGLISTTTRISLHPENETRLLSITVNDTQEQTRLVLQALAHEEDAGVDLAPWRALQTWIASGPTTVVVPYARELADLIPPVAVRLRRDFKTLLALIKTHALLHRCNREVDSSGRVIATVDDYAAIRALVADLMAAGVAAAVSKSVRETVNAVAGIIAGGRQEADGKVLREVLQLDRGSVSRRMAAAIAAGYVKNLEEKKGKSALCAG